MAFFDTFHHESEHGQPDYDLLDGSHAHFDFFEPDASLRDASDFNGSHLFRDNFTALQGAPESPPSHDVGGHSFPPPELTSQGQPAAPSAEPSTADPPMPPPPPQQARKRPDEPDSSCRPRLTPEQTAILEEYYSHTPRPTTVQKKQHAIKLGLTLEKVNVCAAASS